MYFQQQEARNELYIGLLLSTLAEFFGACLAFDAAVLASTCSRGGYRFSTNNTVANCLFHNMHSTFES